MLPIDGANSLLEACRRAVTNADEFDHNLHRAWLSLQPPQIQDLAAQCPPDRVYRIKGWKAAQVAYGVVDGYHGAVVAVRVLGADVVLGCPPSALVDVTDAVRNGDLP